jgi:hypothetical protein
VSLEVGPPKPYEAILETIEAGSRAEFRRAREITFGSAEALSCGRQARGRRADRGRGPGRSRRQIEVGVNAAVGAVARTPMGRYLTRKPPRLTPRRFTAAGCRGQSHWTRLMLAVGAVMHSVETRMQEGNSNPPERYSQNWRTGRAAPLTAVRWRRWRVPSMSGRNGRAEPERGSLLAASNREA